MDEHAAQLLAEGWEQLTPNGFLSLVGPLWWRAEGETVAEGVVIAAHHLNPRGTVHGGMLATLVDRCYGHTIRHAIPDMGFATIDLGVHFLGPAKEGDFLVARATIERRTRDLVFLTCRADCGHRSVARSSAIFKLLPGVTADGERRAQQAE